ncbi:ATP-binding protein [Bdellovibrio sp. NC01]|uniref:HAMP domain-containing sensor histidine kinase n=1 Tax=Bdellovibrio sp. NC01 TaxID=2220073 RepID=UPI00115A5D7E|nr:ATP-binding protein [Bdellovibrio sp. NC01]QDK36260.1 two-component sensor histidine kinase [Bdellovibrio sp. NC01]
MKTLRRKPKRSLRTILIVWFVLFSVVPLAFVTIYSMVKYEKAIDHELSQRLSGNAREIGIILNDYKSSLQQKRDRYVRDPSLTYHLTMGDGTTLRSISSTWLKADNISSLTFFDREGRMLTSVFKDDKDNVRSFLPVQDAVFLSAKYISDLKDEKEISLAEFTESQKLNLILISKVTGPGGRTVGYIEQIVDLNKEFLSKLKSRLKLELILFKDNGQVVVASHPDFYLYKKDFFKGYFRPGAEPFFDLNVRGNPYGFLIYPLDWGITKFYVALGASKSEAIAVLKNVNYAFITVVGAVVVLLIMTILVTSSWVLKPLYDLVDALQSFESQEQAVTIPVKNDTEIGLLTESFNEMSKKIWTARSDLRKKITELESANKELKDTQTKLVHSAKMVSLGQLVAGVAHELNNPIGFIYSNMTHLKEYSEKLIAIAEVAEKNPEKLHEIKEEYEFDYIVKDLPKLVTSCQDGARRTRDIVLGLRNFSRLEEAKLQEIDVHQSLDTTLNLLQGEIKNRIELHRQYEPTPLVHCYASQINQVFMNILSNAVQAIEGNGHVWISTMALKDYKGSKDKTGWVQVSIQDSGKGMSQETLDKIFDPFFTTKGVGQGTGLGLSISYGIVQNHGGEIQVRSQVGVGTEFIVIIPVYPPVQDKATQLMS